MSPGPWQRALRRALLSGTLASLTSTLAISLLGHRRTQSYASGANATSHWLWGESARRRHAADLRHTGVGYTIHHASSIWWAVGYERWRLAQPRIPTPVAAAAVAAIAYAVDYHVVPHRLTPGFDRHLSRRSMFVTYAAFGAGLALAGLLRSRRSHR
jgi:hypothetical protein